MRQERNRLLDTLVCFFLGGPTGKLFQTRAVRTARGVKIADDHVIKEHIVQPPRAEAASDQVRVDVEDGNFG